MRRLGHHHGHSHGVSADADSRKLAIALALIAGFMCVEVVAGILAGSLALLSDAAHMLTDAGALALALVAIRLARRPAAGAMTYGLGRSEIVAAAINGSTLLVLGLLFVYESVRRLIDPHPVEGAAVLVVALVGVVVNLVATWVLASANRDVAQHRGRLPAHPHRPRGLRRHRDRRCRDPAHRLRARRRDRRAVRRRADAARRLLPAARVRARVPRGGAARASTRRRSGARWPRSPA